ncbi:flavodoxin domain-containing protein [Streptomyces sp. PvR034]|uniref:flavodoxin domain-containing protein n=1 Tax=Streptomyces sp. PvR034 TaxID=3156401 RepID=UPI0033996A0C
MRILVGYASVYGSTREIAERVGARLRACGNTAEVRSLDTVHDLADYDAFVLGSAVHRQAWLPTAVHFVRRYADPLGDSPVWIFSVGMPGALGGPWKKLGVKEIPKILAGLDPELRPRGHRLFSGVITPEELAPTGRFLFRLMGCRYGDFRDWGAIEAWADEIAAGLGHT